MKTKIIITSAIILVIVIVALSLYMIKRKANTPIATQTEQVEQGEQGDGLPQYKIEVNPIVIPNVEGKIRSMNKTQIFVELQDGNGSAINIEPSVVVKREGEENVQNLSILKAGDIVSVQVDENQNAKEILIKK